MLSRVASWHQGSSVSVILTPIRRRRSSRPCSVIFGKSDRSRGMRGLHGARLRLAQRLAVDLAGRRLGQRRHEGHPTRVLVLAEPRARELLQLAGERIVAAARRSEEHTSELQSRSDLVCRLLLEKKNT